MTALAIWQTEPCASWCNTSHDDGDPVGSRACRGTERFVNLTLEPALEVPGERFLQSLHVGVEQHHHAEPHVNVSTSDDVKAMTLDEAEYLFLQGLALIAEVKRARRLHMAGAAS